MGETRKLIVEVIDAHDLLPKDGHGSSSPYVLFDYNNQLRRTPTIRSSLNPVWNAELQFNMDKDTGRGDRILEGDIFHDTKIGPTRRNNFLGRVRVSSRQFVKKGEEAVVYMPLEKKQFFHSVRGEIGLKIYYIVVPATTDASPPPAGPDEKKNDGETEVEKTPEAENADARAPEATQPPEPSPEVTPPPDPPSEPLISRPEGPLPFKPVKSSPISDADPVRVATERSSYDLVEKMQYLFVKIVKARSLIGVSDPFVKLAFPSGRQIQSSSAKELEQSIFHWNETFAFDSSVLESAPTMEISVWQNRPEQEPEFLGVLCFDVSEIASRDSPDTPLALQWYRLEGSGKQRGDLMVAAWIGSQADESFPDSTKMDSTGVQSSRSKVYIPPKLWYLRCNIIEAQDLRSSSPPATAESFTARAELGLQKQKTRPVTGLDGAPAWKEDLLFVAAEPLNDEELVLKLESRCGKEKTTLGTAGIPLSTIERRVDDRTVVSRWIDLAGEPEKASYAGRIHVRVCFDGGYHVMTEPTHATSDFRPTARQLWKPPTGSLDLGIIGCRNLVPVKTVAGKGSADAYVVAKYGEKWTRTRVISSSLQPKWNEQYTWLVYDPCTVLTVAVFDQASDNTDTPMGKIRIRISTMSSGNAYRHTYPLLTVLPAGAKRMGEIDLAVRFNRSISSIDMLQFYTCPLLPLMHYKRPIGSFQQESLRAAAAKLIATGLSRSEPPLPDRVSIHMLEADSQSFSMRRTRTNWARVLNVLVAPLSLARWAHDTRTWRKPSATFLAHAIYILLVWHPDLILPTLALYTFGTCALNYRRRETVPGGMKLSQFQTLNPDELDEEFDPIPSSKPLEVMRVRYDRLRILGGRAQSALGDAAALGERVQSLIRWRDPRATFMFVIGCLVFAVVMQLVRVKMVAVAAGFYYLRHPAFRNCMPPAAVNFFSRLPSLSDQFI